MNFKILANGTQYYIKSLIRPCEIYMEINIIYRINRIKASSCKIIPVGSYRQDSMLVAMRKQKTKLYNIPGKKRNMEQILSQLPVRNVSMASVVTETLVSHHQWHLAAHHVLWRSKDQWAPFRVLPWCLCKPLTSRSLYPTDQRQELSVLLPSGQLPSEQASKGDWAPRSKSQSFNKESFNLILILHHSCCIPYTGVGQEVHRTAKGKS